MRYLLLILTLLSACDGVRSISLSASDHSFIEEYFEGQIDSNDLNFFESDRLNDSDTLAYTIGESIVFAGKLEITAHMRHREILVHELVHVLQWKRLKVLSPDRGYFFGLYDHKTFREYGVEQQAELMETLYLVQIGSKAPATCLDCGLYETQEVEYRLLTLKGEMLR